MPRVILALFRHGSYEQPEGVPSAHSPHPLDPSGEVQARDGALALLETASSQGWEIDVIVDSSRLLRAWQTAKIVAQTLGQRTERRFEVAEFDALAERGLGCAANLTTSQIAEVLRRDPRSDPLPDTWQRDSSYRLPLQGAESLTQAGERVAWHLEARARHVAERARVDTLKVLVGHGGSFRHAALYLGVLRADEVSRLSMAHCTPVYLERLDKGRWAHVAGSWKERSTVSTSD